MFLTELALLFRSQSFQNSQIFKLNKKTFGKIKASVKLRSTKTTLAFKINLLRTNDSKIIQE